MLKVSGYAAQSATTPLSFYSFSRRDPGPRDVLIEILYCGVCHTDLHFARNEWGNALYPCVPGHEIVGRVTAVGDAVTRFKTGDMAAVGCLVGSCRTCPRCEAGLEQYCDAGFVGTYNGVDAEFGHTFGGYSSHIVVDQHFVLRVPENLDPAGVAPLLCAGVTTYSPLRHWKIGPGMKVGVAGLGGLGHMGVKLAASMGARVAVLTTSAGKADDAQRLGAQEVIVTRDPEAFAQHASSFDFILDTIAAPHDINAYLNLLKPDATMVQVGLPDKPLPLNVGVLIFRRRNFAGSLIGGIAETQEMLDYCASKGIVSDIEIIKIDQINEAYERMLKSDVKYRFVIDMASLPKAA